MELMFRPPVHSALQLNFRNREKLQAYQREYAQQKRAPGRRKVSKAEQQLLKENYVEMQSFVKIEGASQTPSTALSQYALFPLSYCLVFTPKSRIYKSALIVRSRVVDPQRTASMVEKEENAWQHFEELKDVLLEVSLCWWKKHFKHNVDKFIRECLNEIITILPLLGEEGEEQEEEDRICLHGLRHLIAGAVQELELAQQPKHAATFAKNEGALVWQGRGYVIPILHAISSL